MPKMTMRRGGTRRTNIRLPRAGGSAVQRLAGRALPAYRGAPLAIRVVIGVVLLVTVWAALNWIVQTARKPSEVFFPVSGSLSKNPAHTWREYGPLFETHSTTVITPELLASLAQIEGSGNPVARTYWRWRLSWNPFEVYRPASSAVGMFQIIDGTFAEARRYCIHDHVVVEDGPCVMLLSCLHHAPTGPAHRLRENGGAQLKLSPTNELKLSPTNELKLSLRISRVAAL